MSIIEVSIKTIYNNIHLTVDSLDEISEILSQPYVISYDYKKVETSNYKKLKNTTTEKDEEEVKCYEKRITRKSSRCNS